MAEERVTAPAAEPADAPLDGAQKGAEGANVDPSPSSGSSEGQARLETLQRERDSYYDRLLRTTAEFDNYRKRVERERRDQADQAIGRFLEELLLVVDDFDRALTVDADENSGAYRKGVELIHA